MSEDVSAVSELRDQVIGWMEFPQTGGADDLDALITAARAEALEEAAVVCEDFADGYKTKDVSAIVAQAVYHNAKHLAYRLRALKGTAPQSPWRPIPEPGPEERTNCIVGHTDGWACEARWDNDRQEWYEANNHSSDSWGGAIFPTHWMPLPAPPTEEAVTGQGSGE